MYSIGTISKMMKISVPTLRYYDEEGLLINIKRDKNGNRVFEEKDIDVLNLINCLKNSGMKIKEIKYFIDLCRLGNDSLNERLEFFKNQEEVIQKQIEKLQKAMSLIKFKQWYYQTALEKKDEDFVKNMKFEDMPENIQTLYKNSHDNK